jgi:hypothetical protein
MAGSGSAWRAGPVLAALAVFEPGCVSYTAAVHDDVRRGDLAVRVEEATLGRRSELGLAVTVQHVPRGARLRGASITTVAVAHCRGDDAVRMGREGGRRVDDPLVPGEHVTLAFGTFPNRLLGANPLYLGVLLEAPGGAVRCLTLPIASGRAPLDWRPRQRYTLGVDVSVESFASWLGPVSEMVTLPVEAGVWLGAVHPELGAGVAGAGCPESRCKPSTKDQQINYATAVPFFAGARVVAFETGDVSLGATIHYRAVHLAADTFAGRQSFWMQGPVVSPYVGGAGHVVPGTHMGGAHEALIALELPLGYAFAENGRQSFTVGLNVAMLLTAF